MGDLLEVCLTVDEREAIRLADLMGISHEEAGKRMEVSRATFGRIVQKARQVVADALINGKAIKVEGGNYRIIDTAQTFICPKCRYRWLGSMGRKEPMNCPKCKHEDFA